MLTEVCYHTSKYIFPPHLIQDVEACHISFITALNILQGVSKALFFNCESGGNPRFKAVHFSAVDVMLGIILLVAFFFILHKKSNF